MESGRVLKTQWLAACLLACTGACTGTRTGNPELEVPAGAELVRSSLERELEPDVSQAEREQLAVGNQAFAFDLYGVLRGTGEDNLFFSPYSLSSAIAMTYAGAEGETKTEMASAMHFDLEEPTLHAAWNATDLALDARSEPVETGDDGELADGLQLSIVNAAFARRGADFVDEYMDVLALHYDAGMYTLDFASEPEASRVAINDWALQRTEGRIDELLPEDSISSNVWLVLTNAIYFKARWATQFDRENTSDGAFHAPSGDVTVPLMHKTLPAHYAEGTNYQVVDLGYVPDSVRMLVVLPAEGELEAVEAALDAELFASIREQLTERTVALTLPRFTFGAELALRSALAQLGMVQAFDDSLADFSGISTETSLSISDVYHQAFVAVDEDGTEAAAASAVVVVSRGGAFAPVEVSVDRPFIFLVYDEPTGQILFLGRLSSPS